MVALHVDTFDRGGRVLVRHTFFGRDEAEAHKWAAHHEEVCSYLSQAEDEGRTGEFVEELDDDEVPSEADYAPEGDEEDEEEEEGEDEP